MTVLRHDISAHTGVIGVDAPVANPTYPFFRDIGSETVKVIDGADTTEWQVERGVANTQAARHGKGVNLVANASPYGSAAPSSIVVSASDPGAIGAKNLWLEVVFANGAGDGGDGRLWVRDSTDTGWNSASPLTYSDATTTLIASPSDAAELVLTDANGSTFQDPTSLRVSGGSKSITLDAAGLHLGPDASAPLLISATTPDDPRSGGGLAAPKGSLFANSALATFWFKTGAGATAWALLIQVASPEGITDLAGDADLPTTVAKVNQLLTALRAINVVG